MKKAFLALTALAILSIISPAKATETPPRLDKIRHIIVISLENHSFDNIFGNFPGAEGLSQAGKAAIQADQNGKAYSFLPDVMNNGKPDSRFPHGLANKPFAIEQYVPADAKTGDLVHRFYQEQAQIDGGRMDRFADISDAGGLVMGYYDSNKTALWQYARQYTVADHFFHAAFGGSFLNHFWMICACAPVYKDAPDKIVAKLDAGGHLVKDGIVTPDGYVVNTIYSAYAPHPANADAAHTLPPQTMPTIGDRLSAKGISWAWYSGGWNDALAGKTEKDSFQFHHQPFAYFRKFGDGTPARKEHLKDEADFLRGLKNGTLPAVAFYKPVGDYNWHPGYANIATGDTHFAKIMKAIQDSSVWKDSVIIITFDENGGFWDHVAPPHRDRFGPGVRVPAVIVSPFAKKGFVDHTSYDTTSILKLIEMRYDLAPLGASDAAATAPLNALNLN